MSLPTIPKMLGDMQHLYETLENATDADLSALLDAFNQRYGREAVDHVHPTDGPHARRRFSAIRGMIIAYIHARRTE